MKLISINSSVRLTFSLMLLLLTYRANAQYPVDTTLRAPITTAKTIKATHSIIVDSGFVADGANGTVILQIVGGPVTICNPLAATPSANQNYIRTLTPRKPFINADSLTLKQTCEVMESIQYLDGLGRPSQIVTVKGNPDATKDLVQPFDYDQYGREVRKYLAYTTSSGATGSYRTDALTGGQGIYNFYNSGGTSGQQQGNGIVTIPNPFAETSFEPSPLNRPLAQGSPGKPWGLDSTHALKMVYTTNNDTAYTNLDHTRQVALYTATINSNGSRTLVRANNNATYKPGQLYVNIVKDENWTSGRAGTVEEYKDKQGRVVLKRTFNLKGSALEMLSTYYVYDDLGQLVFVLPPGAKPDTTLAVTQATLNNFCYQYRYDGRNRLTQKKLPGKGWDFMVYNKLDQLVLSQDSMQRTANKWTVIKYDAQDRPVITGIWNAGSTISQATLQSNIYGQAQWDVRDNTGNTTSYPTGYVIGSYPTTLNNYLTINYYDDYAVPNIPSGYTAPSTASTTTQGLPTATKTAVLNPDGSISTGMLLALHYYDDKGRIIKTYSQHYLGGTFDAQNYDELSSAYDFTNQVTYTKHQHHTKAATGATTLTVANSYEYDHMNRKIRSWERINNATDSIVISQVALNEVGQLRNKQLHSTDHGAGFLQTLTYDYNERGWLRHANSSGNLFNMELKYNEAAHAQYNGNISQMFYNTTNVAHPGNRSFAYTYDKLNRLTNAIFTGGLSGDALDENISYDVMGNIIQLVRGGTGAGTLNYTSYTGNQLRTVTGYSARSYDYDGNGNGTSDGLGKAIRYNLLNLPDSVGTVASYTYDANGQKLRNRGSDGTWDYINGIVYHNNAIAFISTEEGRAIPQGDTYSYEYNLKDHLGNVRVSIDQNSNAARIIQEDEYYSFGLRKPTGSYDFSNNNRYLYNGKEIQTDLANQYDYGARFYDPVIGRWATVDPLAEKSRRFSPYVYGDDNPITNIDPDGMETSGICCRTTKEAVKRVVHDVKGAVHAGAQVSKFIQTLVIGSVNAAIGTANKIDNVVSYTNHSGNLRQLGDKEKAEEFSKLAKSEAKSAAVDIAIAYAGGKVFGMLGEAFNGTGPKVAPEIVPELSVSSLSRGERLSMFKNDIANAGSVDNPNAALGLINKTLDNIESKYAGSDDRMYGILDDKYKTYHDDGSITALTKGQRIEVQSNGDFTIYNRKDGSVFLEKVNKK